jgi:UDP-N-acetylglucosamine--N-acetylmuramyl-(pentapeptide) pyrophosphoryl-undecaprenol N-acetylglucosamine transferase
MERTLMIMAGGTGGHVFPGLAVAEHMRSSGWRVVWLGSPTAMEGRLVPARGIPMAPVQFSGLRGKGLLTKVLLPFRLLRACAQASSAIFSERPDVVLGMGGYVAFPGGIMAAMFRKPLVVHEQNSVAGLTNKVLAKMASRVLQAFPGALPNAEVVGNPVRGDIASLAAPGERYASRSGPLRLLVVGGSLGAQALNDAVPKALAMLPENQRPLVKHQAGAAHIDSLRVAYRGAGLDAEALPFIDDMAAAYAQADLLICRAGALTIAEIAAAGVASVLVPFPHAVDDHQTGNARYLSDAGAAILVQQTELTPERLAALLKTLTREQLLSMAEKARSLALPHATRRVASVCEELAVE